MVRYRCNNIVLGGKGGANTKSQKFLHLIARYPREHLSLLKLQNALCKFFAILRSGCYSVMAESMEKEKDHPSRISRYSKSNLVLSTEYKNTIRNVRLKNTEIK